MTSSLFTRSLLAGLFFVMCGAAAPAWSETAAPAQPTKDISKLTSGYYVLDKDHANVIFKINHLGYSTYFGRFNKVDAKLNFDAKSPDKSTVEVTVDTSSIDTNNEKLQTELKGEKFFNTAKFPTATFKSLHLTPSGDAGTMIGELTMLGVSKPLALNVIFNGGGLHPFTKKEMLGFNATAIIKRSEWGLNALLPMVGDEVQIEIEAEFNKATAPAPVAAPAAKPAAAVATDTKPAAKAPDVKTPDAKAPAATTAPAPTAKPATAPAAKTSDVKAPDAKAPAVKDPAAKEDVKKK